MKTCRLDFLNLSDGYVEIREGKKQGQGRILATIKTPSGISWIKLLKKAICRARQLDRQLYVWDGVIDDNLNHLKLIKAEKKLKQVKKDTI